MTTTDLEPRIYVACLAAYNSGKLHGAWIDATQDADCIEEDVKDMLQASPEPMAEEWAIHDHEGFGDISIGEGESFERVSELARLLEEHGEAYAAYVGNVGEEYATAEGFENSYVCSVDSAREFAIDDWYELNEVPDRLAPYIDDDYVAREQLDNVYYACQIGDCGEYHIFSRNC